LAANLAVRSGHVGKVGIAVDSEQGGHVGVAGRVEQSGRPSKRRGCEAHCGDRVTHVVLAITKRPFPVFPGLAPVDRGQANEEAMGEKSTRDAHVRMTRRVP
jgi:hypothetical protein